MAYMGAVDSGEQALAFCEHDEPDVILMDLRMPGMGGVAATQALKERHPEVQVIALSSSDDGEQVKEALRAKASGYVVKTASAFELAHAIRAARHGQQVLSEDARKSLLRSAGQVPEIKTDLTKREREVLDLVALGLSNEQIADQLPLTLPTVEFDLRNLCMKLGVQGRSGLVARAYQLGLLPEL